MDGIGLDRWGSMPSAMGDAPFLWEGHENYRKVAFVRHPVARFLSAHAYMHSAARPSDILQQVAGQKDEKRDQHFRSQRSFLKLDGDLLPTEIYRVESLPDVWPFDQWPIQHRNKTPNAKAQIDVGFEAAILDLFAEDLEIWERAK